MGDESNTTSGGGRRRGHGSSGGSRSGAIGTSTMKKGPSAPGGSVGLGGGSGSSGKKDGWDDDW